MRYRPNYIISRKPIHGFTLIELLVVIAIIALLLSILGPSLKRAQESAREVICRSNLDQWGLIFSMYANDNNDSLTQSTGSYYGGTTVSDTDAYWMGATLSYYEAPKIRFCPSTRPSKDPDDGIFTMDDLGGTFEDWGPMPKTLGLWWDKYSTGSYGINEWAVNPQPSLSYIWGPRFPASYTWRTIYAEGAGNIPLFMDCVYVGVMPFSNNVPPAYSGDYSLSSGDEDMQRVCLPRHNGGINGIFLDLSARKIGLKELWKLNWHRGYDTNNIWTQPYAPWPEWMTSLSS